MINIISIWFKQEKICSSLAASSTNRIRFGDLQRDEIWDQNIQHFKKENKHKLQWEVLVLHNSASLFYGNVDVLIRRQHHHNPKNYQ